MERSVRRIIILIGIFGLIAGSTGVNAFTLESELITGLEYNSVNNELPPGMKKDQDLESELYSRLVLHGRGFAGNYEYVIDLTGDLIEQSIALDRLTLSTLAGNGVFETGKKDWIWGKGFSYPPTYPLDKDKSYWGGEWKTIYRDNNVSLGFVLEDGLTLQKGTTSWLRWGRIREGSDLTGVFSWQDRGRLNLGLNYSRDMLNGLTTYGGLNIALKKRERDVNYLLGVEYLFSDKVLVIENYQQKSNYLLLSLSNASIFTDWEWSVYEVVNLDDHGRRESFKITYLKNDNLLPSLEIFNFAGPDSSDLACNPVQWGFKLTLTMKFNHG